MAELSEATRLGRGSQGRVFETHYRHETVLRLSLLIEYMPNDFVWLSTGDNSVGRVFDCSKYYRMVLDSIPSRQNYLMLIKISYLSFF